jgi:DNA-binding transcriptional ArsR family regulator
LQVSGGLVHDAARFFKVLGDEVRLRMLWLLFNERELCVCDFVEVLDVTQSKASRHLITLKHAGLVADRRAGLWSHYSLKPLGDDLAKRHLRTLRETLARRPAAAPLLDGLRAWLDADARRRRCAPREAPRAARRRLRARSGGGR